MPPIAADGIVLSEEQQEVHDSILDWFEEYATDTITVGGYAGTGKTTLTSHLRQTLLDVNPELRVAFACYTGKAALVLKEKLKANSALHKSDYCGTIHGLIYVPVLDEFNAIVGWERSQEIPYDIIIIDEASMVDAAIWRDLNSYGLRIIAIGDHGQLPPVSGSFNLMDNPEFKLEEIHRQARGNPIIRLSILAREQGVIPPGDYSDTVRKIPRGDHDTHDLLESVFAGFDPGTMVVCGFNKTRIGLNRRIRNALGFDEEDPMCGERLICLKNNRRAKGGPIYNGMLGTLEELDPKHLGDDRHWFNAQIAMDGAERPYRGLISAHQFGLERTLQEVDGLRPREIGDLFDWGYALTVHKAQGSQARRVLVFEERSRHWDDAVWRRWLYTAVTRAEEELYVIG